MVLLNAPEKSARLQPLVGTPEPSHVEVMRVLSVQETWLSEKFIFSPFFINSLKIVWRIRDVS